MSGQGEGGELSPLQSDIKISTMSQCLMEKKMFIILILLSFE